MNNTFLGNYPVPNPIPDSYRIQDKVQPELILVGEGVLSRLVSFGMEIEDVLDFDKLYSIFTPREFNTFFSTCDFTMSGYSTLSELFITDFTPFNRYSVITEKQQRPTELSPRYIDMLHYHPVELEPHEALSFQLGYSIDKIPEQLDVQLYCIGDNIFAGVLSVRENDSKERYLYNVCENACSKLYEIYGLRWVAQSRVYSELVRLSQLSALNRNS